MYMYITETLDKGENTCCIYFDFRKAFDKVPHKRLINKLSAFGLSGNLKLWLSNFLTNRKHFVQIGNKHSATNIQKSGIPQGTILGPLLFIIYINDLPGITQLSSLLFADDFKVFSSGNNFSMLQNELEKVGDWSKTWLLDFNYDKCCSIAFGNHCLLPELKVNNHVIKPVESQNDLGVIIDKKLNFNEHIVHKVNKANKILGIIRRSFCKLDNKSFINLYTGLVRSHLEYGVEVWFPHLYKHIDLIENVQRRVNQTFIKLKAFISSRKTAPTQSPTLTYRRKRGDMIQTYKILNNYYNLNFRSLLHLKSSSSIRLLPRNNQLALFQEQSNKSVRQNFFSNRVTTLWNSLPNEVVLAPNLNSFKNRLDTYWSGIGFKFLYR